MHTHTTHRYTRLLLVTVAVTFDVLSLLAAEFVICVFNKFIISSVAVLVPGMPALLCAANKYNTT